MHSAIHKSCGNVFQYLGISEDIVGMQEPDYLARRRRDSLVEGIVDYSVVLRNEPVDLPGLLAEYLHGSIGTRSVDHNVLEVRVSLVSNRPEAIAYSRRAVVGGGDEGDLHEA